METQQISEKATGGEWFAAWMPSVSSKPAATEPAPLPAPAIVEASQPHWLDEVRAELKLATEKLLDPSAEGVRSCLPYLERAISVFGSQLPKLATAGAAAAGLKPSVESLQNELSQAKLLFENAYALQAGWAALIGLNVDGTAQKVLYNRTGELVSERPGANLADGVWEG